MRTILLLLFYTCTTLSQAQSTYDPSHKFPVSELNEDFKTFRKVLEEAHPDLYHYTSKERFNLLFDSLYNSIQEPMTEWEFRRTLSVAIAATHCSHTFINTSKEYDAYYRSYVPLFPYRLERINGEYYVKINLCSDTIPAGSKVLSVNGTRMSEIEKTMLAYLKQHAFTTAYHYDRLGYSFGQFYSWYVANTGKFRIDYITPQGQERTIQTNGITQEEADKKDKLGLLGFFDHEKPLQFDVLPGNIGLLTVGTFMPSVAENNGQDIFKFFESSFEAIKEKNIQSLIIDVRSNPGGLTSCSSVLYEYIAAEPFKWFEAWEVKSLASFSSFHGYTIEPTNSNFPSSRYRKNEKGTYYIKKGSEITLHKPKKNAYTGKVYILQNGISKSATAVFLSIAKSNSRAVFIGEEDGENYSSFSAGNGTTLTLAHTKLRLTLPDGIIHIAVKDPRQDGRGVIPEYNVTQSLDDLIKRKDTVLQFALELAGNGK